MFGFLGSLKQLKQHFQIDNQHPNEHQIDRGHEQEMGDDMRILGIISVGDKIHKFEKKN